MTKVAQPNGTKPRTRDPKKERTVCPTTETAFAIGDDKLVLCDTKAPIEYGCRVALTYDNHKDFVIFGTCMTKHPRKAKRGIAVEFQNAWGEEGLVSQAGRPGSGTKVYRVVGVYERTRDQ